MAFTYKFDDGAEVEVPDLVISSREMRKLRHKSELDIAYDLMESKLSEDELAAIETYTDEDGNEQEREFSETVKFFNAWFEAAVEGK
jgi:hypothetical protein